MRFAVRCKALPLTGAVLALLMPGGSALAQKASNWRVYRTADGLAETACSSVNFGAKGEMLVRHISQSLVTVLDGYTVQQVPAPPTSARKVWRNLPGQLWAPAQSGLYEFKDGTWVAHSVPAISKQYGGNTALPVRVPIRPVRQGMVLFLLPDALMVYYARDPAQPHIEILKEAGQTSLGAFRDFSFALPRENGLWVSGTKGIAKITGNPRAIRPDTPWQEFLVPDSLEVCNFGEPLELRDGRITVLAETVSDAHKAIVGFDGQHWSKEVPKIDGVRFGWENPSRSFWAVTQTGLFRWEKGSSEVNESDEVSARQYFDAALEPGGAFWLATSDGLFRFAQLLWRTPASVAQVESLVHCVAGDRPEVLWFVAGNALHLLSNDSHEEFPLPQFMTRPVPQSIYALRTGIVVAESAGRLATFDSATRRFTAIPDGEKEWRVLGKTRDGLVWVQSRSKADPGAPPSVEVFDGTVFEPFKTVPPTGSLGTNFTSLYAAQNGELWLGADRGVAWYHAGKWSTFDSPDQSSPEGVSTFVETGDGRTWCVAQDRLWEFDGRTWNEIQRNFDRVNSITRTRDGSIWVGSNTGCRRYFQGTWLENGIEEGLPAEGIRQVFEDGRGEIWAATTRGLSLYHPKADTDPPRATIQELRDKEREIPEGATVTLSFTAVDKWKFTARERLLFSYRLDQREWSEFSDLTRASFTDLAAGKHYFQVRAMDRNCNVGSPSDQLEFTIVLPWFKETRLVLIITAGAAVALFFAGLAFNRHWRLVRSYAEVERKIAQRTRELETANRELLQSQKMTALGTLAAGIAHDFNNILSIIQGSAQIIEQNVEDPAKIRTRVDRIKTVVEQGSGIVKAMLGFSRDSSQQNTTCDVNAVLQDTVKLLGDRFLREVNVTVKPAVGLPQLVLPKDLLQQILLNFIFNSAEAMTGKSEIILSTRLSRELPEEMVLVPARASEYVEISVTDFGSGIPPEVMPRIFEPFFTTKAFSARRGTGLGLSMVYELAKRLDAGLTVRSTAGEGSTFTVIMPVKKRVDQPVPASPEKQL